MNRSAAAIVAVVALAAGAQAQTVQLEPLSSGAMKKMGGYMPQRLELGTEKPDTIKRTPDGLVSPLFGVLKIGSSAGGAGAQTFHVVVDEPDGKPYVLYVDANGNGDLTDDEAAEWKPNPYPVGDTEMTRYSGGATVQIRQGSDTLPAHLGMYRFDKNDSGRAALRNVVLYYCDYAYEGEIALGEAKYKVLLTDNLATGDFRGKAPAAGADGKAKESDSGVHLKIDVNGNDKFDVRGEEFDVRKPFNIKGTTYEIAAMSPIGARFEIVKSEKSVPEVSLPPDHSVGKKITAFEAKRTDDKAVKFPGDYKGKVVMLDFWATWCGPCMAEVPNVVGAYEKFHDKGFDILGISLDRENALEKLTQVTTDRKMTWPQVYDGKWWKAEIAQMYVIQSIPAAFLVDGDTGEILADGRTLRGEKIEETIAAALAKKKAN